MNKKLYSVFAFLFLINSFHVFAQKLPNTDIYLVSLIKTDSGYTLGNAELISSWDEYDNQPSFSFDSQNIFYSTLRDMDKTDIYMYAINTKQNLPFIETGSVSEFSPMPTPDGRGISVVRQDAVNTQQVWIHYYDGTDPLCVTPQIRNIGYYCWVSDSGMVIRRELSDTTSELQWMNLRTKQLTAITKAPGISICKVPAERAVYYIDKNHRTTRLMKFNAETQQSDSLTTVPEGVDNFTTTIEGEVWLINKGILYSWSAAHPKKWKKLFSFNEGLLSNAYRLSTSRDMKWLALVVMPEKK